MCYVINMISNDQHFVLPRPKEAGILSYHTIFAGILSTGIMSAGILSWICEKHGRTCIKPRLLTDKFYEVPAWNSCQSSDWLDILLSKKFYICKADRLLWIPNTRFYQNHIMLILTGTSFIAICKKIFQNILLPHFHSVLYRIRFKVREN